MSTLHIHLDESGNFTFNAKGSRYYIFAVVWTFEPQELATRLTALRFRLIRDGHNLSRFHASEDQQPNRNAVVKLITEYRNWSWAGLVVEKRKVYPTIRAAHEFYPTFAVSPLRFVFRGRLRDASNVLIYTDSLPVQNQKDSVEKAVKYVCRAELPKGLPFCLHHHPSNSNAWLQVADYCAWALARKWEQGDTRTYDILQQNLACEEMDVLAKGKVFHY